MVGITYCTYNILGHRSCQLLVRILLSDCFCPLQHFQQLTHEILFWRKRAQSFLRRPFQVDRDTIRQLHCPVQLLIFHPWHNLEVNIASVLVSIADEFNGIDDLVLRGHTPLDDTRREKDPLYPICTLQRIESPRHLIGGKGHALRLAAPGTKRTVKAVALASSCHHCLQDGLLAFGSLNIRNTLIKTTRLVRHTLLLRMRLISRRLVESCVAQLSELS